MKKSALLAVSALSLGVVGLASFAPVASAVNANVNMTVTGGGGIVDPGSGNGNTGNGVTTTLVDLGEIGPNSVTDDKTKGAATVSAYNNNEGFTITMKANSADAALVSGDNKIPTGADIEAGKSAWGYKLEDGAYKAVPNNTAENGGDTVVSSEAAGTATANLKFKASTDTSAKQGAYTATIVYTAGGAPSANPGK